MTFTSMKFHKLLTSVPLRPTLEHALTALNIKTQRKQEHIILTKQIKGDFQTGMSTSHIMY